MTSRRFRPRRRLRSEILPISLAVAMPLLLAWIFPFGALSPAARGGAAPARPASVSCAFVDLTEDEEYDAMLAARTAWHISSRDVKSLRIEMFASDLPEDDTGPVIDFSHRTRISRERPIAYEPVLLPTDLRAAPPAVLQKPEPPEKRPTFGREELLKLD